MVNKVSTQLYLSNEIRIPVRGNHIQLVKFSTKSDPSYQVLLGHLRNCMAEIDNHGV